jgi:hypothetical protein
VIFTMPMEGIIGDHMNRITTIKRHVAKTAIRFSWAVLSAAERLEAQGERMEAWADRRAERWGCLDEALATVTEKASEA